MSQFISTCNCLNSTSLHLAYLFLLDIHFIVSQWNLKLWLERPLILTDCMLKSVIREYSAHLYNKSLGLKMKNYSFLIAWMS